MAEMTPWGLSVLAAELPMFSTPCRGSVGQGPGLASRLGCALNGTGLNEPPRALLGSKLLRSGMVSASVFVQHPMQRGPPLQWTPGAAMPRGDARHPLVRGGAAAPQGGVLHLQGKNLHISDPGLDLKSAPQFNRCRVQLSHYEESRTICLLGFGL